MHFSFLLKENIDRTFDLFDRYINNMSTSEKVGTLLSFGTVGVSSFFIIPRISPMRALILGFRSLIKRQKVKSQRIEDIEKIRDKVHDYLSQSYDQFLVVRGPKGIGKTVAIKSALANTWSVCFTKNSILPGENKKVIIDQVLTDFTNIKIGWFNKTQTAEHVIFWNNIFTFGVRKPIIVISAQERKKGEPYAQVAEAARDLADMGIRVIIDSSEGALRNDPFTLRECFIELEPMPIEMLKKIPEIQKLIGFLEKEGIFNEVIQKSETI